MPFKSQQMAAHGQSTCQLVVVSKLMVTRHVVTGLLIAKAYFQSLLFTLNGRRALAEENQQRHAQPITFCSLPVDVSLPVSAMYEGNAFKRPSIASLYPYAGRS